MSKFEQEGVEPKLGDDILPSWKKQAEAEIKNGYRTIYLQSFRGKENVEIHIFHSTHGVDTLAAESYSRAFNKYLRDPDILSKKVMIRLLSEREIWGKEEEKLVEDTRERMRDIEFTVAKMRKHGQYNKQRMEELRNQWTELKNQLQTLLSEQQMILGNTVEGLAEAEERVTRLSHLVKFADGERVWDSLDAINAETDKVALSKIGQEATLFWMGLTNEIINELPAKLVFGGEEDEVLSETDTVSTEIRNDVGE